MLNSKAIAPAHIEPAEPVLSATARMFGKLKVSVLALTLMTFVDISRYQWPMNWATLWAKGVRVVILRASVGSYYIDPRLQEFYDQAKTYGFLVGFYHATAPKTPDLSRSISPAANIDTFLNAINGLEPDFAHTLDNELPRGLSMTAYTTFLEGCYSLCPQINGIGPSNYTRQSLFDPATKASPILASAPLHAARYKVGLTSPWSDGLFKFRDYKTWRFWQYSADGNGKGHEYGAGSDDIDLDYFNGTLEDFERVMGIVAPPDEPPPDAVSIMWDKGKREGWW